MNLEGKVALITGGGTGIGAAIAKRFVNDGARVCITGRRQEMLDNTAQTLSSDRVKTCSGDVTDYKDVERMVEAALSFDGRLDVLVNNAAMDQVPKGVIDIDIEVWKRILDVNLTGPLFMMKASIPHMIRNGSGSVINISSVAGVRSIPEMPAYCATKGGLIMLTKQAALDYGPSNVRCNVVCPGGVRTEMIEGAMGPFAEALDTDVEGVFSSFTKDVPLRRIATPDEISGICSYLASDDSSFMTGAELVIDGGTAVVDVVGAGISGLIRKAGL